MGYFWTNDEINVLRNNYGKVNFAEILKLIPNRTERSIRVQAQNQKVSRHIRMPCDDNYFSYWAGLIAADGYIPQTNNQLTLYQSDVNVIRKFLQCIKSDRKITTHKKNNPCSVTSITSEKIVYDLYLNFNIGPRKTYHLLPPQNLSYENSLAFITGLIDGDGCISIIKANRIKKEVKYIILSIMGTLEILTWVSDILDPSLSINRVKTCNIPLYLLHASWHKGERILYKLYDLPISYLRFSRKWDKVEKWRKQHQH
jgi:hypothetical protein